MTSFYKQNKYILDHLTSTVPTDSTWSPTTILLIILLLASFISTPLRSRSQPLAHARGCRRSTRLLPGH
jgi:hypothetical protein